MTVAAAHFQKEGPTSVKIDAIVRPTQRKNAIVSTTLMRPRCTWRLFSTLMGISQVKHFVSPLQRRPPQFKQAGIVRVYPALAARTIRLSALSWSRKDRRSSYTRRPSSMVVQTRDPPLDRVQ